MLNGRFNVYFLIEYRAGKKMDDFLPALYVLCTK